MPAKANIYLTGFSGAGKSVSGRMASNRLGWAFVDTDDLIEQRAGKQIPQVFADDGEERFRDIERGVLLDISGGSRQVIATGGGVPVDPSNRKLMQETGIIVRLKASPEMIHERLSGGKRRTRTLRPLLGDDARPWNGSASCCANARTLIHRRISLSTPTSGPTPTWRKTLSTPGARMRGAQTGE